MLLYNWHSYNKCDCELSLADTYGETFIYTNIHRATFNHSLNSTISSTLATGVCFARITGLIVSAFYIKSVLAMAINITCIVKFILKYRILNDHYSEKEQLKFSQTWNWVRCSIFLHKFFAILSPLLYCIMLMLTLLMNYIFVITIPVYFLLNDDCFNLICASLAINFTLTYLSYAWFIYRRTKMFKLCFTKAWNLCSARTTL